jgi:hypothetical protein
MESTLVWAGLRRVTGCAMALADLLPACAVFVVLFIVVPCFRVVHPRQTCLDLI